ncbi:hypothetical protein K488DRAFT_68379 [Vararia minispora EC-137]|uniref:Uncharacterized protein n=1 Tax=Vararia minispora EC-137 TaxID=1314806 RepID=A0ACB8QUW5_9AGAM|nr:hypothetical protein K488DRAFT_68379 [Vararia minispora EC-137]
MALRDAVAQRYGPIEEFHFFRDSDNKLSYLSYFIVTFEKVPQEIGNAEETFEVEVPSPTRKPGGPSLANLHDILGDSSLSPASESEKKSSSPEIETRPVEAVGTAKVVEATRITETVHDVGTVEAVDTVETVDATQTIDDSSAAASTSSGVPAFSSIKDWSDPPPRYRVTVQMQRPQTASGPYQISGDAPRPMLDNFYHLFSRLWVAFDGFNPNPDPVSSPHLVALQKESRNRVEKWTFDRPDEWLEARKLRLAAPAIGESEPESPGHSPEKQQELGSGLTQGLSPAALALLRTAPLIPSPPRDAPPIAWEPISLSETPSVSRALLDSRPVRLKNAKAPTEPNVPKFVKRAVGESSESDALAWAEKIAKQATEREMQAHAEGARAREAKLRVERGRKRLEEERRVAADLAARAEQEAKERAALEEAKRKKAERQQAKRERAARERAQLEEARAAEAKQKRAEQAAAREAERGAKEEPKPVKSVLGKLFGCNVLNSSAVLILLSRDRGIFLTSSPDADDNALCLSSPPDDYKGSLRQSHYIRPRNTQALPWLALTAYCLAAFFVSKHLPVWAVLYGHWLINTVYLANVLATQDKALQATDSRVRDLEAALAALSSERNLRDLISNILETSAEQHEAARMNLVRIVSGLVAATSAHFDAQIKTLASEFDAQMDRRRKGQSLNKVRELRLCREIVQRCVRIRRASDRGLCGARRDLRAAFGGLEKRCGDAVGESKLLRELHVRVLSKWIVGSEVLGRLEKRIDDVEESEGREVREREIDEGRRTEEREPDVLMERSYRRQAERVLSSLYGPTLTAGLLCEPRKQRPDPDIVRI